MTVLRGARMALTLLTRIPAPRASDDDRSGLGAAAPWFPVVGALVGAVTAAALWGLTALLAAPALAAAAAVGLGAVLTGALHLDGLADTADGFGSDRPRAETLRILRDPAVGSFGVAAVVVVLLVRTAAAAALAARGAVWPWLVVAPVLARWAIVALVYALPYARSDGGLGASVAGRVRLRHVAGATAAAALLGAGPAGWGGAVCWAAVAGVAATAGVWCRRRLGGVTGDTLGAATELAETAAVVAAVAWTAGA